MRKLLIVALISSLPVLSLAQDAPSAEPSGYNLRSILLISIGAIAGMAFMDFLIGGELTIPSATAITPAVREAGTAGAVFGDQVAAATAARNAKARFDIMYALLIGSGAVLGGLALDQFRSKLASGPIPSSTN